MKIFIVGKDGNIGSRLSSLIDNQFELTDNIIEANIIALCTSSKTVQNFIFEDDKIYLNFSSANIQRENVLNGIGCSTLSVLLPLLSIKEYLPYVEGPINIVSMFPQNAISNKSKLKNLKINKSVYTLSHKHQFQLEKIFKKEINMSHFVTPADNYLTSNIFISFSKKVNLFNSMQHFDVTTRDYKTWNIISIIDNVEEPINYLLKLLELKLEEK